MKALWKIIMFVAMFCSGHAIAQSVGIGTTSPNASAILDLNSTNRALLLPRMNNTQMNAISNPQLGSLIYNTEQHQFMGFVRSYTALGFINGNPVTIQNNQWVPVSTGPRILAWGIIDTFPGAVIKNGSNNFSIEWNGYKFSSENIEAGTLNQYEISLTGNASFNIDSMMVHVTPIGGNDWDQTPSVWFTNDGKITIKFTDVSRVASGNWNATSSRRRSRFSFTVYDLRTVAQ